MSPGDNPANSPNAAGWTGGLPSLTGTIAKGADYIESKIAPTLGNMTLIGIGIALGLGALLIGSRETIVNVSTRVAKAVS